MWQPELNHPLSLSRSFARSARRVETSLSLSASSSSALLSDGWRLFYITPHCTDNSCFLSACFPEKKNAWGPLEKMTSAPAVGDKYLEFMDAPDLDQLKVFRHVCSSHWPLSCFLFTFTGRIWILVLLVLFEAMSIQKIYYIDYVSVYNLYTFLTQWFFYSYLFLIFILQFL